MTLKGLLSKNVYNLHDHDGHNLTQLELDLWGKGRLGRTNREVKSAEEIRARCVHLYCNSFHTACSTSHLEVARVELLARHQEQGIIYILFEWITSSWPMLSLPGVRLDWPTLPGIVVACCKARVGECKILQNKSRVLRFHLLNHILVDQPLSFFGHAHLRTKSQMENGEKLSYPYVFLLVVAAELEQGKN